jgi:AcrR family transcriptional regulator
MGASSLKPIPRTQAERSATTRAQLLDATIECLAELGYARTTTSEVARRAGLTRGAQLHHFRTKHELVVRAVEHLFERRLAAFLEAFAALPEGADRLEGAIDLLWESLADASFPAVAELLVAARTDPELRASVAPLAREFDDTVERTFEELFAGSLERGPIFEIAPRFAFALLQGLAAQRLVDPDDDRAEPVVAALKNVARLLLPRRAPTENPR